MSERISSKMILCLILILTLQLTAGELPLEAIDGSIREAMQIFRVPGLALALVQNDSIIYQRGFGTREIGKEIAIDENTLFAMGSISKSTVALALGMLIDKGKLNWDDPVTRYLPYFAMSDPWVSREMTIRDLLVHRSGLVPVSGGTLWYGSDYAREDIIRRIHFLQPVSSFRSQYTYQNIMYLVAGEIILAVTGLSWDDFIRSYLLDPLEMPLSNTRLGTQLEQSNIASPHAWLKHKIQAIPYRNYDNLGPAASLNSNAVEMANYVRMLLNGGIFKEKQIVSQSVLEEIQTPQMTLPIGDYSGDFKSIQPMFRSYGLGWFIKDYRGRKMVYHSGGVDGMRALVVMLPEEKLGIILLTNQEEWRINYIITYWLLDHYLGIEEQDWLRIYRQDRDQAEKEQRLLQENIKLNYHKNTRPSLAIPDYTGHYRDRMYGDIYIIEEKHKLVLSFSHTPAFTADLEHWHYDTFQIKWRDSVIPNGFLTFRLDSQAKIESIELDQPDLLDVNFSELEIQRVHDKGE